MEDVPAISNSTYRNKEDGHLKTINLRLVFTSNGVEVVVVVGVVEDLIGLLKIENRSHKQSQKLDGIGVRRIRTSSFLPIPFATTSLMIQ